MTSGRGTTTAGGHIMSGARDRSPIVLLVEDETLLNMLAEDVLSSDGGFMVIPAADADEALAVLKARPDIAVVVTDINMPGSIDGLELADVVHRTWPHIGIVVTSGRFDDPPLPPGARFISKPWSPSALIELVWEVLRLPTSLSETDFAGPILSPPASLDGPTYGNGLTGGLGQPLSKPEE